MTRMGNILCAALLCGALSWLTGCSGESPGRYPKPPVVEPKDNVKLDLRLFNGDNFAENVASVDIGIFDTHNNRIRTERISKSPAVLTFEAGNYHLVLWANVDGRVKYENLDTPSPVVTYSDVADFETTGRGEQVMYAPYSPPPTHSVEWKPADYYLLEVPVSETLDDVIYFTPAYCSIDVYIDGLPTNDPDRLPNIQIDGFTESLSYFGMKPVGGPVKVSQQTKIVERDGHLYNAVSFEGPLFNENELQAITLAVNSSEGERIYGAPLSDVLAQAGSNEYDPSDLNIDILVSVEDSGITVSFPKWSSDEVGI